MKTQKIQCQTTQRDKIRKIYSNILSFIKITRATHWHRSWDINSSGLKKVSTFTSFKYEASSIGHDLWSMWPVTLDLKSSQLNMGSVYPIKYDQHAWTKRSKVLNCFFLTFSTLVHWLLWHWVCCHVTLWKGNYVVWKPLSTIKLWTFMHSSGLQWVLIKSNFSSLKTKYIFALSISSKYITKLNVSESQVYLLNISENWLYIRAHVAQVCARR